MLITRQGQLNGQKVKIEFKPKAKVTQQKGRRIPIQLQEAVQEEIEQNDYLKRDITHV